MWGIIKERKEEILENERGRKKLALCKLCLVKRGWGVTSRTPAGVKLETGKRWNVKKRSAMPRPSTMSEDVGDPVTQIGGKYRRRPRPSNRRSVRRTIEDRRV